MHGPVRVAKDAMPGKAQMVVELPSTSLYESLPTTLVVEIR